MKGVLSFRLSSVSKERPKCPQDLETHRTWMNKSLTCMLSIVPRLSCDKSIRDHFFALEILCQASTFFLLLLLQNWIENYSIICKSDRSHESSDLPTERKVAKRLLHTNPRRTRNHHFASFTIPNLLETEIVSRSRTRFTCAFTF